MCPNCPSPLLTLINPKPYGSGWKRHAAKAATLSPFPIIPIWTCKKQWSTSTNVSIFSADITANTGMTFLIHAWTENKPMHASDNR